MEVFFGVAFEGADIVFHQEGLNHRNSVREEEFRPQEGNYIHGKFEHDEYVIRTDPFGYCKLYVYKNGGDWILSDSYYEVLRFAKSKQFPLSPNIGYVESQKIGGMFGDQFTSFKTAFNEIELVPHWFSARILLDTNSLAFDSNQKTTETLQYMESLVSFLNLSRNRMNTWISHDQFVISSDVTGGIDSRVPISMISNLGLAHKVSLFSKPGDYEKLNLDRNISSEIARTFGFVHTQTYPNFSRTITYEVWKQRCLGVYPVFFVRSDYPISQQRLTGRAGELYRNQYRQFWKGTPEQMIESLRHKFHSERGFQKAKSDFMQTCDVLENGKNPSLEIALAHYRAFRNRYHFGQDMSLEFYSSVEFCNTFDSICPIQNDDFFAVYHDMISMLSPRFLEIPFDSSEKDFSGHWPRFDPNRDLSSVKKGTVFLGNQPEFLFENPVDERGRLRAIQLCTDIFAAIQSAARNQELLDFLKEHGVDPVWESIKHPEDLFSFGRKFKSVDLLILFDSFGPF
jgi:hypothetical protein